MSYINRAKALRLLQGECVAKYPVSFLLGLNAAADEIRKMPTADVVAVVRCKDCKFRNTPDCAMWYECDNCGVQYSWENNNDYCSCGERREENEG